MGLKWTDAGEIAVELAEQHPGVEPLEVPLAVLARYVMELEEFDDPAPPRGAALEAIQLAWLEELEEEPSPAEEEQRPNQHERDASHPT